MNFFTVGILNRELSLFEKLLVFILIGIVAVVFLRYVDRYASLAEFTRLQRTVSSFRQELNLLLIQRMVKHDSVAIAELDGINPFTVGVQNSTEQQVIPRYLGEFRQPDPDTLEPGNWYFDLGDRQLVYLLRHPNSAHADLSTQTRLRLQVRLLYQDMDTNGVYSNGDESPGIQLQVLDHLEWNGQAIY